MQLTRKMFLVTALSALIGAATSAGSAPPPPVKPDLADMAQGRYAGDVISDARGSSRSDIDVSVTKIGKNRVRVVADYERIPAREFTLTRAMQTVQNVGGTEVFLLDLSKSPLRLDLTIDDASWSGSYVGALNP